ncbi:MAG TPA: DUF523 domain-containing protein, partial [Candidatus Binataceae bacterium]|nr:DUF523 domain-containing protein [Candidatus Binataceae bacterium]
MQIVSAAGLHNSTLSPTVFSLEMGEMGFKCKLDAEDQPIRIGVSSCLLGANVRFDGGHKRSDFLTETLGSFVEFVPVCPEVEIGLGVPRETLRLVRDRDTAHGLRLISNNSRTDLTDKMKAYAKRRVAALGRQDLSGYVLKKNSPSC